MENIVFPKYLCNPEQVKIALNFLENNCLNDNFEKLFSDFGLHLKIQHGDPFPISAIGVGGMLCRARVNDEKFNYASKVSEIGVNYLSQSQGRANAIGYHIFYAANCKKTAAFEVLQDKPNGIYTVTIGCWIPVGELWVANLIDGDDPDFKKLGFAQSFPNEYLKDWPEAPRISTKLITNYASELFKKTASPGLYNKTNIIAGMCFSLKGVDGIAYAATSDNFEGCNFAIKDQKKLNCESVESWQIIKLGQGNYLHRKIANGIVLENDEIVW